MAISDITSSEILRINTDLKSFLQITSVNVKPTFGKQGLDVAVEEYCGDDLDSAEFKEYCENLAEEITERLDEKFRQPVYKVTIKNLDTDENFSVFNKSKKSESAKLKVKKALKSLSSVGESRDDVVELLVRARNSLLESVDALYDAKNLAERNVSKKVAQDIQEKVIDTIDGESSSTIDALRQTIKSLSATSLIYEE
jgi:hypothetical protein